MSYMDEFSKIESLKSFLNLFGKFKGCLYQTNIGFKFYTSFYRFWMLLKDTG